ncbi:hypothetical protein HCN44_008197 [Aphidius gifuensis]|uniref:Replication protein A C-terminal domain-containing protein n=1 Tax=Aphidius gifuensis TaxID=684658 RepID=A0A835CPV0_APHGI|nr:replication protein A 32 kDa subunit-like [Aphidius gifuensis]KAF7989523.1 hypothetical protein HCN44_008197 [Aphidius gifuensis]
MWESKNNTSMNNGGYMDESYSVPTPAVENRRTESNCIIPVTVKQLYKGTPDKFTVGGHPAKHVCIYAVVRKIDIVATKISYEIEDQTGKITAIRWLEVEDRDDSIQVNKYVRIIGIVREQADLGRHLFILCMEPVNKLCQVYSHLLEITDLALSEDKRAENGTENVNGHGDVVIHGLGKYPSIVLQIIRDCSDGDGIEKNDLLSKLPNDITAPQVDEILESLTSEGHIYTTCTDDYYKAT